MHTCLSAGSITMRHNENVPHKLPREQRKCVTCSAKTSAFVYRGVLVPGGRAVHTCVSEQFDVSELATADASVNIGTSWYPSYGFLTSLERAEASLFTS